MSDSGQVRARVFCPEGRGAAARESLGEGFASRDLCAAVIVKVSQVFFFFSFHYTTFRTPSAPRGSSQRGITRHCFLLHLTPLLALGVKRYANVKSERRCAASRRSSSQQQPPLPRSTTLSASRAPCNRLFIFSFVFIRNLCSFLFFLVFSP